MNREELVALKICEKRMCIMSKNKSLDRISWLPEHVLHVILDKLPLKDAARSSVLSKTWKSVCSSYPMTPFVNLDHNLFGLKSLESVQEPDIDEIRKNFIDFVDDDLFQLVQNKLRVHKLALYVAVSDSICFSRVDHLIELVTKVSMVEELCLFVQTKDAGWKEIEEDYIYYSIPFSVLASKGLRSLNVHGCKFSSSMSIAFSSLQHLSLTYAVIDEDDVMNITRSCPAIETLEFDHCTFWIETLELSVFPRLKKAAFLENYNWLYNIIVVDHTSLESFKSDALTMCEFTPSGCGSIRELILSCQSSVSPLDLFVDLDTFPLLEEAELSIELSCLDGANTFRAANHHLRRLSLSIRKFYEGIQVKKIDIDCPNLEFFEFHGGDPKQIFINCPSLRQFHYVGDKIPVLPVFNSSPACLEDIYFRLGMICNFTSQWFIQLRGLSELMAQLGRVVRLNLDCFVQKVDFAPKEFGANEALRQHNVHLEIYLRHLHIPVGFVDGLIWSTRATTLTICGHQRDFVKEMCQKLAKKSQDENCEKSCDKCWWHHIQKFEVENSIKEEDVTCNLTSLVETPLSFRRPKTSFKLGWRINQYNNASSLLCI